QLFVEDLAHERMREGVDGQRRPRGRDDQLSLERLFEGRLHFGIGPLDHPAQDAKLELLAEHGGLGERVVARWCQTVEPAPDDLADAFGQAELLDGSLENPAALALEELARLDQVTQHLAEEERIAFGLAPERLRDLQSAAAEAVACRALHR